MDEQEDKLRKLPHRHAVSVAALDDPPLGHTTAIVLKTIEDLGSEAFGWNVLETISLRFGVWMDTSQVYSSIRKLLKRAPPLIELAEKRKSEGGGPDFKIYRVTDEGRKVLKQMSDHYLGVVAYLGRPAPAAPLDVDPAEAEAGKPAREK